MMLIDFSNYPFEDNKNYNYYFPSISELSLSDNICNLEGHYGEMDSYIIGRIELKTAHFEIYERIFKV